MKSINVTSLRKCLVSFSLYYVMASCLVLILSPKSSCAINVKQPGLPTAIPTLPTGVPTGLPSVSSITVPTIPTSITMPNYCTLFGSANTMCKYATPDPSCARVSGAPTITQTTINSIVDTHNTLRAKVANNQQSGQPSASNMKQLVWNAELALVAQAWANQCTFAHDTNRLTPAFPTSVGQNVAYAASSPTPPAFDFPWAINQWYDEVAKYTPGTNNVLVFSSDTGHYTQVVWAETFAVGCGFAQYTESGWTNNLYVCNYGPAGNVLTRQVYKVGTACTACNPGVSCSTAYPGLCSPSIL